MATKKGRSPRRLPSNRYKILKKDTNRNNISDNDGESDFEVERIADKRVKKGKVEYFVKWAGYPESENTWQTVNSMNCPRLIKEFERLARGEQLSSPQKTSSPQRKESSPQKKESSPQKKGSSPQKKDSSQSSIRHVKNKEKDQRSPTKENNKALHSGVTISKSSKKKHQSQKQSGDWEDSVLEIETMSRTEDGELIMAISWADGDLTEELASEANVRCPQKVIQFYESRLRFPEESSE